MVKDYIIIEVNVSYEFRIVVPCIPSCIHKRRILEMLCIDRCSDMGDYCTDWLHEVLNRNNKTIDIIS